MRKSKKKVVSAKPRVFITDAEIADDSVACKQVIVGYKQTPKYELQCEDEQP